MANRSVERGPGVDDPAAGDDDVCAPGTRPVFRSSTPTSFLSSYRNAVRAVIADLSSMSFRDGAPWHDENHR